MCAGRHRTKTTRGLLVATVRTILQRTWSPNSDSRKCRTGSATNYIVIETLAKGARTSARVRMLDRPSAAGSPFLFLSRFNALQFACTRNEYIYSMIYRKRYSREPLYTHIRVQRYYTRLPGRNNNNNSNTFFEVSTDRLRV